MFGDHISRQANHNIRIWGSIVLFTVYLSCIALVKTSDYAWVGPPVFLSWIGGVSLYDHQERRRLQQRLLGRVSNFGVPAGFTSRLLSDDPPRPDPQPTPIAFNPETNIWTVVPNPEVSKVERIEVPKPIRVSRYERISDPVKWVI